MATAFNMDTAVDSVEGVIETGASVAFTPLSGNSTNMSKQQNAGLQAQSKYDTAATAEEVKRRVADQQAKLQAELQIQEVLTTRSQHFQMDQDVLLQAADANKDSQFRLAEESDKLVNENLALQKEAAESWNPLKKLVNAIQISGNKSQYQNNVNAMYKLAGSQIQRSQALAGNINAYNADVVFPTIQQVALDYVKERYANQSEQYTTAVESMRNLFVRNDVKGQQQISNIQGNEQTARANEAAAAARTEHAERMKQLKANDPMAKNVLTETYLGLSQLEDNEANRRFANLAIGGLPAEAQSALMGLATQRERAAQAGKPLNSTQLKSMIVDAVGIKAGMSLLSTLGMTNEADAFAYGYNATLAAETARYKAENPSKKSLLLADQKIIQARTDERTGREALELGSAAIRKQAETTVPIGQLAEGLTMFASVQGLKRAEKLTKAENRIIFESPGATEIFKTVINSPMDLNEPSTAINRSVDVMDYLTSKGMGNKEAADLVVKVYKMQAGTMVAKGSKEAAVSVSQGFDVTPVNLTAKYAYDTGRTTMNTGFGYTGMPVGRIRGDVNVLDSASLLQYYESVYLKEAAYNKGK